MQIFKRKDCCLWLQDLIRALTLVSYLIMEIIIQVYTYIQNVNDFFRIYQLVALISTNHSRLDLHVMVLWYDI